MSASPAGGTPTATPNGTRRPPMPRRPQPAADPLMRRKPQKRPPRAPTFTHNKDVNGLSKPSIEIINNSQQTSSANSTLKNGSKSANSTTPAKDSSKARAKDKFNVDEKIELAPRLQTDLFSLIDIQTGAKTSGFTTAKEGTYTDFPLYISKRDLLSGLRPHVARFISNADVNPSDQKEWVRPVRLHRRDPRAPPPGGKAEELDAKDAAIEEEQNKQAMMREKREEQRKAAMADVAPGPGGAKRSVAGKKKITQVFAKDETEEQRAKSQLKYEESLPWHMEDFDGRQTWVGAYEAPLSNTYAQLIFKDGKCHVIPLEKWYKFTQKRTFKTQEQLEAEEAKRMQHVPKWRSRWEETEESKKEVSEHKKAMSKLYDGTASGKAVNSLGTAARKDKDEDADELDFEEDLADDEEDPLLEGDLDDLKETQKRIKRDQLQANIFDMKEEKAYDKAEKREKLENLARKDGGKGTRKALMKRERNYIYESDSENPYSEESESEDSEEEGKKDEQIKQEGEDKKNDGLPGSGASTKENNTPSNRKKVEAQRSASSKSLKRAGSPGSEGSGNESSRKKQKNKHGTASTLGSGVNTPTDPASRPRSPAQNSVNLGPGQKKPTTARGNELKRSRGGAGSGSDGEGAGSAGEMSDGSRKKIKLKVSAPSSKNVSPGGSRAVSPIREGANGASSSQTKAKSVKTEEASKKPPTLDELKQAVPGTGMPFPQFINQFKSRMGGPNRDAVMGMVKNHFKLVKVDGVNHIYARA